MSIGIEEFADTALDLIEISGWWFLGIIFFLLFVGEIAEYFGKRHILLIDLGVGTRIDQLALHHIL